MPSKLDYAKNHFAKGLSVLQNLLDNKEKIKKGLIQYSLLIEPTEGNKVLLTFFIDKFYEFLEDDFGPRIKAIEKQVNEGKLSKRKYNTLIEDVYNGNNIDMFELQFSPIYKLLAKEQNQEENETSPDIIQASSEFNYLCQCIQHLTYTIEPIESIIEYGTEREDNEYYYFIDKKNDKEKIDKRKLQKGIRAEQLMFDFDINCFNITIYIKKGLKPEYYLDIDFKMLGFLTKKLEYKKSAELLVKLLMEQEVSTINNNDRQSVKQINDSFKAKIGIQDEIIKPKKGEKIYELVPDLKRRKTSDDVLGHQGRYSSYDENILKSDGRAKNTINRS